MSLAFEEHRHLHAAHPVVADHDHIAVGVDFLLTGRDEVHGNKHRTRQVAVLVFPGFAHIQQQGLGTGCASRQSAGSSIWQK